MKTPAPFLLFLSCLVVLQLAAQTVSFEKYTSRDGLISDRITAVAQDENGFMWFGSYFGICRYNGIRFQKIELPFSQKNKYVTCFLSANHKMYAGFLFGGGLAEYSGGELRSYFISAKDSAADNDFVCMTDSRNGGIILCNSSGSIYQFKNGVFTHIYTLKQNAGLFPNSIQEDRNHTIWLATDKGLILLPFPYQKEVVYFPDERIFSLVKDAKERIWFNRSGGKATVTQSCDGWAGANFRNPIVLPGPAVLVPASFSGNVSNGVWGVEQGKGLVHVSARQKYSYQLPLDYSTDINVIFADRENNIWIANEPGVFKVSHFNIQTYRFNEIAAAGGTLCRENDSVLWVTNSKAIYRVTQNAIQKIKFPSLRPDYFGSLHFDYSKNLWTGMWNDGIWRAAWRSGKWQQQQFYSTFNNRVIKAQALAEDDKGNLFVAGASGLFHIKANHIIDNYHPKNVSGQPAFVSCMSLDKKSRTLWLGDNASGVIKLKYTEGEKGSFRYSVAGYISSKDGLKDTYTRSILFDDKGNLWVGGRYGGIYRIKETTAGYEVTDCSAAANLSCNRVTDIKQEDSTAVWFATCNGIYRFEHSTNQWKHYNSSHGILNAEVFSLLVDSKNKSVWALTAEGVTKIPIQEAQNAPPPLVSILSVNVLGKHDSTALLSNALVKYSYTQNSIGFGFAGASFIDEKKTVYRYMLEGYDKTWSEPVTTNTVNYASLPPGKYRFLVLAANVYGEWSKKPASFRFQIVQPFYRSSLFVFVLITLGIFILYLIRIQRLKHQYKIEKLRLNIAQDLHDDIGSTLGSINLLSQTASRRLHAHSSTEEIDPIFQKIGQSAENTLEAMDDIVWSINPQKDKFYDLVIRMREFAIPLLETKSIQFGFAVEGDNDQPLGMNLRRNAFLIFKEAIHNILKHSAATKVDIKINIGTQFFEMHIIDNGKGFHLSPRYDGNGLKNLQSRAKSVKGSINISPSPAGTEVVFTAPVR